MSKFISLTQLKRFGQPEKKVFINVAEIRWFAESFDGTYRIISLGEVGDENGVSVSTATHVQDALQEIIFKVELLSN